MGRENVLFKSEEKKDLPSVATFLRQLADRLDGNQVVLRQGTEEIVLDIPNNVILELKAEEEDKKGKMKRTFEIEIEWIEGSMLQHVQRVFEGRQIYAEPSIEFTSSFYPPLYFYVCSVFAYFFGLDFFVLRLVSFLSSLGCFTLVFLLIFRQTKNYFASVLAVGLFAATFVISGAWFDVAHVDMLFLFLILFGLFLLPDLRILSSVQLS